MDLPKISLDVLAIKEGELVYANENVKNPPPPVKPFFPPKTKKLSLAMTEFLSKIKFVSERETYVAKEKIEANTTPHHGRSASIPESFSDDYGNKYAWMNFKGIGRTDKGGFAKASSWKTLWHKTTADDIGLFSWRRAERDRLVSNYLLERGFRTSIALYIIKLGEIPAGDGKVYAVNELRQKSKRTKEHTPVVMVRGMRNFLRIWDLGAAKEGAKEMIKDAMEGIEAERGIKFCDKREYLFWFASTLAEQLAILYSVRAHHNYLTGHNITLAAEIVDLDSVTSHNIIAEDKEVSKKDIFTDFENARSQLEEVGKLLSIQGDTKDVQHTFLRTYLAGISKTKFSGEEALEINEGLDAFLERSYDKWGNYAWAARNMFLAIEKGYKQTKKLMDAYSKK